MKRKSKAKPVRVIVEHVPAPDAEQRLALAFSRLLRAAARAKSRQRQTAKPTRDLIAGGATEDSGRVEHAAPSSSAEDGTEDD